MCDVHRRAPDLLAENERLRAVNAELVAACKMAMDYAEDAVLNPGTQRLSAPDTLDVTETCRAALARASKETP